MSRTGGKHIFLCQGPYIKAQHAKMFISIVFRFSSIKGELIPHLINAQFKTDESQEDLDQSNSNTDEEKEKGKTFQR